MCNNNDITCFYIYYHSTNLKCYHDKQIFCVALWVFAVCSYVHTCNVHNYVLPVSLRLFVRV